LSKRGLPATPGLARSRVRAGLLGTVLIVASSLVALGLFEIALRLAGIGYPSFYRDDAVLGSAHREGSAGWWSQEGHAWVQINADGLRDREHAITKPPGTYRIAVLGDSFAAAFEVEQEETFWSVMERELSRCPALGGRTVEALDFGVAGYGTAREYRMLENRVWKYDPDLVLLAFFTGNDVQNNSWTLDQDRRAYYYQLSDGRLHEDQEFLKSRSPFKADKEKPVWGFLHARLRLVQVYERARRTFKDWRDPPPAVARTPGAEPGLGNAVFAPPPDATWADAWQVTEALVRAIAASVREHGARLAIAVLSNGIQVDPDAGRRAERAAAVGMPDLLYPDRRVAGWAAELRVPHVVLVPELLAWAEANQTCVHGFANALPCSGHWNEHGHRLAGERIARLICEEAAEPP